MSIKEWCILCTGTCGNIANLAKNPIKTALYLGYIKLPTAIVEAKFEDFWGIYRHFLEYFNMNQEKYEKNRLTSK